MYEQGKRDANREYSETGEGRTLWSGLIDDDRRRCEDSCCHKGNGKAVTEASEKFDLLVTDEMRH